MLCRAAFSKGSLSGVATSPVTSGLVSDQRIRCSPRTAWFPRPIESADLPEINKRREKYSDEDENLAITGPAQLPGRSAPGKQEDRFQIEDYEERRNQVVTNREAHVRGAFRHNAAFVGFAGRGLGMSLSQQVRNKERCSDQKKHERKIDNQWPSHSDERSFDALTLAPDTSGQGRS